MFRIHGLMLPKYQSHLWAYILSRRCLHLCQALIFILVIFGIYLSTFYYAMSYDKMVPSTELYNESVGFTETAILVNTEGSNIVIQKQQSSRTFQRPMLYNETITVLQTFKIGDVINHCGLPKTCGKEEFAVHIYTGKDHKDEPKLCVDGKYVLAKNINDAGRGINVVVIDSMARSIFQIAHFDTYEHDSTALETLLLTLRHGDIAILLTFDEPSRKLSRIARLLLFDLGSAFVQNLGYRGSWYLVTQKGLNGFSPYEDLNFVESSGWPKHHDVRFCVPFQIKGEIIHPDEPVTNNPQRVEFCSKHGDLPLFCDADVVNDPLVPSPVWKQPAAINKIYNVPIIVMSGEDPQFLSLTLETLVRQPGIKTSLVAVYHLPKNSMVQSLSDLFGFMSEELFDSINYCEHIGAAFERTNLLFPDTNEILFIGENIVLAPDFLYYMGQLLAVLNLDSSLLAVSAFNENGFKSVSGDPSLAYRTQSFTGAAILARKDFFKNSWCNNSSLSNHLYISSEITGDVLVPDVSRVALASVSEDTSDDVTAIYFSQDRTITYDQNIGLRNIEKLFLEEYDKELEVLISSSLLLELKSKSVFKCLKNPEKFQQRLHDDLSSFVSNSTNLSSQTLVMYFHQDDERDASTLQYLTRCFGLFYHPSYPARGLYKGILRFILHENQVFLVGSKSSFFHLRSDNYPVLQMNLKIDNLISSMI